MKRGLSVSHGSQEWGGKDLGRPKMKHENGCGCFMVPKSGVGRRFKADLNNNLLLLRCVGKSNVPHEMGVPRVEWQVPGENCGNTTKHVGETCGFGTWIK